MKLLGTALVIGSLIALVAVARRRARRAPIAGSMFVGAVDEVELGAGIARPMRPGESPERFDPEEVPSEHPEINELRNAMPFG